MRTVLEIDAKNKLEALAAIDIIREKINDSTYSGKVIEKVQITNEGKQSGETND